MLMVYVASLGSVILSKVVPCPLFSCYRTPGQNTSFLTPELTDLAWLSYLPSWTLWSD